MARRCRAADCTALGKRIVNGDFLKLRVDGVVTLEATALAQRLFKRGCDANDAEACWELAASLNDARQEAVLLEKSCKGGFAPGCAQLAMQLISGDGVKRNPGRAARLLQPLCEKGDGECCNSLGVLFATGDGVPRNKPRAIDAFSRACDVGDAMGCENVKRARAAP